MRQALIVLFAQVTLAAWAHPVPAADVLYPVQGEWHFCSDFGCTTLQIGEKVVTGTGQTLCVDATIKRLGPSLAVVECHSDVEGLLQYYFLFDTENRASFWSISSKQSYVTAEYVRLAQRRLDGPIPAELLGRWNVSNWTPSSEDNEINHIDLKQNQVTITHPRRSTESSAIQLSSSPEGGWEYDIEVIFGAGKGFVLRLRRISQGVYITKIAGKIVLLHRDERPPTWFAAELIKSCEGLTDSTLREKCYSSRALCEMIAANEMSPQCIALVKRQKQERAAEEVMKNLSAIAACERAYLSEWKKWVGNQPFTPVADRSGNNAPVAWVRNTRFSILGFAPEGDVQCSYALERSDFPSIEEGFSAKAHCDLDANGKVSVWKLTGGSINIEHSGDDY